MVSQNRLLGEFRLFNLTPAPAGETIIDIEFTARKDGILEAKATDRQTGESASQNLTMTIIGSMTEEKIEKMKKRLEDFSRLEEQIEEALKAKYMLETSCSSLIDSAIKDMSEDRESIQIECNDIMEWLNEETETIPDPNEYYKRFNSLKRFFPEDEDEEFPKQKLKPDYSQ